MHMSTQVTTRGQITIDRAVRRELGVEPGMVAHQRVVDGRLEVLFLPSPHRRSLAGVLRDRAGAASTRSNEEIEQAVQEAVADELGE
jgi:bifunctional DNA-binding transcriptional regulator/antitoxin component of YhaV-PrlF toxin-antitoxin module